MEEDFELFSLNTDFKKTYIQETARNWLQLALGPEKYEGVEQDTPPSPKETSHYAPYTDETVWYRDTEKPTVTCVDCHKQFESLSTQTQRCETCKTLRIMKLRKLSEERKKETKRQITPEPVLPMYNTPKTIYSHDHSYQTRWIAITNETAQKITHMSNEELKQWLIENGFKPVHSYLENPHFDPRPYHNDVIVWQIQNRTPDETEVTI